MRLKKLFGILAGLVVLASPFVLAWQRQNLIDWWRLRGYQPTPAIAAISEHTTMNDLGRKLFYVHSPALEDKSSFGNLCPSHERTIVLGCYITHRNIYIFDVTDDRLSGIEEVTAAHEMLHAAYDRLSKSEREHIDNLTSTVLKTLTDQRIKDTVEAYRQRDASVVPNELHSILGTEVRDLPTELEAYYARYFVDRKKIVEFSEAYEAEFTNRQNAIAEYDQQLSSLKLEIDGLESDLRLQNDALQVEQAQLFALRDSNPTAYNQAVPGYNQKVQSYNAALANRKALIETYNEIVEKRNQIASEEQDLLDAIDSSLPSL